MEPGIIQQKGYVWLELAREDILPLTLLQNDDNRIKRISSKLFNTAENTEAINADIFTLFPKPERGKIPEISKPKEVEFFKGHDVFDMKSAIKADGAKKIPLLDNANALGELKLAKKLLYSFTETKYRSTNEILLEEHLNICKPKKSKAYGFIEKLQSGKLYVVTEVLETTNFSVKDISDFTIDGKINLEAIEKLLKASASTTVHTETKQVEGYDKSTPVTFALKASKILYNKDKDRYTLSKKPIKIVRGEDDFEMEEIKTEIGMLNIS